MDLGRIGPHTAALAVFALVTAVAGSATAESAEPTAPGGQATSPLAPPAATPGVPGADVSEPAAPVLRPRPRFVVSAALGASLDSNWGGAARTFVSPAFAGTLGFGDGPLGFELRLVSSQASGRSAQAAPDRLSLDALLAVRPWAARHGAGGTWGARFLRAATINAGLAAQRVGAGPSADWRGGLVLGAYVDLPVGPSGPDGEFRLRVAGRRLLAGDALVGDVRSGDSTEFLAGPVVAF